MDVIENAFNLMYQSTFNFFVVHFYPRLKRAAMKKLIFFIALLLPVFILAQSPKELAEEKGLKAIKLMDAGNTKEALELLMNDEETDAVVMIGEIGGQLESDAAYWYKNSGIKKPIIGFIAGETAPAGRTMGHAGAIVGGSEDTAQAKKRIMRECGIHVVDSPALIGEKVKEVLS